MSVHNVQQSPPPMAIPVAQPVAHIPQTTYGVTMVLDSTIHHTTHYCRSCGKSFQPKYHHAHTAQYFRCSECTGTKSLVKTFAHSCVIV